MLIAKEHPMSAKYALGIDYGTESARTVLVDLADGREVASPSIATPTASSTNASPARACA